MTVNNIKACMRGVDTVVLWLDCDREGEAIAFDVVDICHSVKRNINVLRATFSAVTHSEIEGAMRTLAPPRKALSDAVRVRQEIDLRIGASFTRF